MAMWLRLLMFGFLVGLGLPALPANAGQPATQDGIDVIVGDAQGAPGDFVTIPIQFVPGPNDNAPGGRDDIASVQFSIGFTGLQFDDTDSNPPDLVPDAIHYNPDSVSALNSFALFVVDLQADRLDLAVTDPTRLHSLPRTTLLTITFRIPPQALPGPITLLLSNVVPKDTSDPQVRQAVDEAVDGVVTVTGPTSTPTRSPTATATPSPTQPPVSATPTNTQPRPTARPTRTPGPNTPGPNTPPPGYEVTVSQKDGGCAITPGTRGGWPLVTFAALLFVARRRLRA